MAFGFKVLGLWVVGLGIFRVENPSSLTGFGKALYSTLL